MDEQTLRLLQRLRASNLALTAGIRARLDAALTRRWRAMDSWRDPDMSRLLNDILPIVSAAERSMVDATIAHLAATSSAAAGSAFRPARPRYQDLTGAALRGVDPSEVFMRPQMVLNDALAKGKSLTTAVTMGERRLLSLGSTNLQLAKRDTVAAAGKGKFYRRVLTGSENCALCVIASTQRYRQGSLMPIHPGCDCGEEEIIEGLPPQVIDPALLEMTHAAIERRVGGTDRNAFDLALGVEKRTASGKRISDFTELIATRQHGELGPVLTWRSDHFRDAAEAASLAS